MQPNPAGWATAAVLLFVGASMVVDPEIRLAHETIFGLRNFEQRLRGRRWALPMPAFRRSRVRITGVAMIVLGLLLASAS
jgi:hypothetical protein